MESKTKAEESKQRNRHRFEIAVYDLLGRALCGSVEPGQMYGLGGAVCKFFEAHREKKDSMWVNAAMYADHDIFTPEQGAALWFSECCLPVIKPDRHKD